jgi:hypothetical protein
MCRCGTVKIEAVGLPILTGSCYCTSCQEAGRQFEQLASAPPLLDLDGGTGVILYRKDRVRCVMGQEYLEERRLRPDSPDSTGPCHVLQFGNVPRLLERALAVDVPKSFSDRRAAT